jgi:F-type H+-transporting ATPase subunit delta
MYDHTAAKRYARALFSITGYEDKARKTFGELVEWAKAFEDNPDFLRLLLHPEIPQTAKEEIIKSLEQDANIAGFLALLVKRGRLGLLSGVIEEYVYLINVAQRKLDAIITSAVPLSARVIKEYVLELTRLTGRKINLANEVEPDIIGGVRLTIGDRVIDQTLVYQLQKIKKMMSGVNNR